MPELNAFPRFISDKPDGKDLFAGQSQNTLAENICQFINENEDCNKKVIGIEGEWGSGKSNVITILKEKLKAGYYFFVFDAWGHQEDLTRRSILEGLLIKLIDDEVLNGKKDKWDSELKNLLSKTVEKQQKNIPQFSWV
jgi:predicted KAP-like P-loop ATPase